MRLIPFRPFGLLKRIVPRDLMARALLIIVIPLLLLQVITAYVFFDRHWDIVSRRLNSAVASEIALVIRLIETRPDQETQEWAFSVARILQGLAFSFTPDAKLPSVAPGSSDYIERALTQRLVGYIPYPYVVDARPGEDNLTVHIRTETGLFSVEVSKERMFTESIFLFVFWIVSSSIVLFGVAAIFMRNQVRPLLRLARAADAFGKGRAAPDLRVAGATEVRQAAQAFIAMRNRIQRQIEQRTAMLAGVSHDLRTPLTRMKLQLAMLEDTPALEDMRADIAEMERMIESYLDFARGGGTEVATAHDLGAALDAVVARHIRAGGRIMMEPPDRATRVMIKRQAFERCLDNLLVNAMRHAQHATLRVIRHPDHIGLVLDDDGPGIPPDQRETVFRPFQRLETSRNAETGGTGLGLTVARDLIRGMGGDIVLGDSPLGGLRVTIKLPL